MNFFALMSIIMTLAAMLGYLNNRYFHLPTTIAIMSGSLLLSALLLITGQFGFAATERLIATTLSQLDFHALLIDGMLSLLLFAGALTVDLNHLKERKWEIGILATASTLASTVLIGTAVYYLLHITQYASIPFIYCLLFGALISPTDPIAVLAIFKEVKAPPGLNVTVTGESLFNDGVGIVVFLTLYQVAFQGETASILNVTKLFFSQAIGGITYGIVLGMIGHRLISQVDDHKVQVLITLAMATGGYALADAIGVSGPLAMVSSGIFIGNKGKNFAIDSRSRHHLEDFWELVDEVLNAILFFLIGLELLVIEHNIHHFYVSLAVIPLVLLCRLITVGIPISLFKLKKSYLPNFIKILVWGGLRGGLAVALALAIPESPYRPIILTMTYSVVVFSVIVQGLSIKPLVLQARQ